MDEGYRGSSGTYYLPVYFRFEGKIRVNGKFSIAKLAEYVKEVLKILQPEVEAPTLKGR